MSEKEMRNDSSHQDVIYFIQCTKYIYKKLSKFSLERSRSHLLMTFTPFTLFSYANNFALSERMQQQLQETRLLCHTHDSSSPVLFKSNQDAKPAGAADRSKTASVCCSVDSGAGQRWPVRDRNLSVDPADQSTVQLLVKVWICGKSKDIRISVVLVFIMHLKKGGAVWTTTPWCESSCDIVWSNRLDFKSQRLISV